MYALNGFFSDIMTRKFRKAGQTICVENDETPIFELIKSNDSQFEALVPIELACQNLSKRARDLLAFRKLLKRHPLAMEK